MKNGIGNDKSGIVNVQELGLGAEEGRNEQTGLDQTNKVRQAVSGHNDEGCGQDMVLAPEENIPHVCYYMANMPITKGAIRKLRADKSKTHVNLLVKRAFKEAVSKMRKHPTVKNLVEVYKRLDRAAKSRAIHKNKADRLKSRLSRLIRKK